MSKHLGIFGSFHRIITSSNVSVRHSSAGIALRSVMCLSNDTSYQCVILTILAQPSTELCIRKPCCGSNFSLNSHHLTLGPLHLTPLSVLHSYHASCLALVLGIRPSSKTGPWFRLYLRYSQFPSVAQRLDNPDLEAYPCADVASTRDCVFPRPSHMTWRRTNRINSPTSDVLQRVFLIFLLRILGLVSLVKVIKD